MCEFYKNLYTSKQIQDDTIENYLNTTYLENTVPDEDKHKCDKFPTLDECTDAVKAMKLNKSPGLDGLTTEFYQMFWGKLKYIFYDCVIEHFEKGELAYSQKQANISLIFKKGEKENLKNYRPLSLTNIDYKIIAFVLSRRLQRVVHKLISENQTAYVKGRYIGINARTILDIYEYCENNNIDGSLIFLDFEKAFDSVEWNFMYKVLEKFNFGKYFINWIKILYNKPLFKMKNNGWLSKTVKMERGIRQGCPISALLFILVVEIMAVKIGANDNIKGFNINDSMKEIKILQHADDCTIPAKDSDSIKHIKDTVNEFCKYSGVKLNIEKTEVILLGNLKRYDKDEIHGFKINKSYVKCLGVYIGHDKDMCFYNNFTQKIEDISKLVHTWKSRHLTIFGKCVVINTLALPKLLYVASILPISDVTIKSVKKVIFSFIWGKRDRIKRNTLVLYKNEGGTGLIDIECKIKSLKAAWVKYFVYENNVSNYINAILKQYNIEIPYLLKLDDFSVFVKFPQFYSDVLNAFSQCRKKQKIELMSIGYFLSQPIWCNNSFVKKGKALYFEQWLKSGILYVKELLDDEGDFLSLASACRKMKSNVLGEIYILKNIFSKLCKNFDILKQNM